MTLWLTDRSADRSEIFLLFLLFSYEGNSWEQFCNKQLIDQELSSLNRVTRAVKMMAIF